MAARLSTVLPEVAPSWSSRGLRLRTTRGPDGPTYHYARGTRWRRGKTPGLLTLGDGECEPRANPPPHAGTAVRWIQPLRFKERPPLLLHLEFVLPGSADMPRRMNEYFALILGILQSKEHRGTRAACVVVYLDPRTYRHDPGRIEVEGDLGLKLSFSYKVIKQWEFDPKPFLESQCPGFYPFVPLMAGEPVDLLLQSQAKIAAVPEDMASAETKRELLTIQAALASRVITDRELLRKLFSEIRIMGENYFLDLAREEGIAIGEQKGMAIGEQKGRREEARRAILGVLECRFSGVPSDLSASLEGIADLGELEALLKSAATCADLESFLTRLSERPIEGS